MVDECIPGDDALVAGSDRSAAVVIILKVADSEAFIQQAYAVNHLFLDQQAEPDEAIRPGHAPIVLLPPVPGEPVQLREFIVADRHLLLAADVVGDGANESNLRLTMQRR